MWTGRDTTVSTQAAVIIVTRARRVITVVLTSDAARGAAVVTTAHAWTGTCYRSIRTCEPKLFVNESLSFCKRCGFRVVVVRNKCSSRLPAAHQETRGGNEKRRCGYTCFVELKG